MEKQFGEERSGFEQGGGLAGGKANEESFLDQLPPKDYAEETAGQRPGFLELLYGVLFEPSKTMAAMAKDPPLAQAALTVTLLGLVGTLMTALTVYRMADGFFGLAGARQAGAFLRAFLPLGILLGLFWSYVKWAAWSAFLHLVADLLGGRGGVRSVLTATGFAALPSLFLAPVQLLAYWLGRNGQAATVILILAGLAVTVWTVVLLVVALRELHGISALRALLAVFSPLLAIFLLVVMFVVTLGVAAMLLPTKMPHFPLYF